MGGVQDDVFPPLSRLEEEALLVNVVRLCWDGVLGWDGVQQQPLVAILILMKKQRIHSSRPRDNHCIQG